MDMRSEESKEVKVKATWCCVIAHNMIIRFRRGLAAEEQAAEIRDYLVPLVAQVEAELRAAAIAERGQGEREGDDGPEDGDGEGADVDTPEQATPDVTRAEVQAVGTNEGVGQRKRRRCVGGRPSAAAVRDAAVERRNRVIHQLWAYREAKNAGRATV
jgi:hypothetical protein